MQNQIQSCPSCQDHRQSMLSILSSVELMLHEATTDFENHDGLQYYRGRVDALQAVLSLLREETPGVFSTLTDDPGFISLIDAIEPQDKDPDTVKMTFIVSRLDNLLMMTSGIHQEAPA